MAAPSHLSTRVDFEALKPRPWIEEDSLLTWMTDKEWEKFREILGNDNALHLCERFQGFGENEPKKWKKYTSHYQTLLNWHRMELGRGKLFYVDELTGAGYYPRWMVEKKIGITK